jgi:rod shape-determining protein MreC
LEKLKAENQRLAGWEARAFELERRLADLSAIAHAVQEGRFEHRTGRIITDAGGPFARSALLSFGRNEGLRVGHPVISADGVVGRIQEIGEKSSRILLLTDLSSRVPVLVGDLGINAILMGDNGEAPRLAHLPAGLSLKSGDRVVTSGVGGIFPRGLRIGTVTETPTGYHVELHARLSDLDHVSVLLFDSPALDLIESQRTPATTGGTSPPRSLAGPPAHPEPSLTR